MTSQSKGPQPATPSVDSSGVPQRVEYLKVVMDGLAEATDARVTELEARVAALETFIVEHCHGLPGQFNRQTTEASDPYHGIHEADPAER